MSADTTSITYNGPTPGADVLVYTLFTTAPNTSSGNTAGTGIVLGAFPGAKYCAQNRMKRFELQLVNTQSGTLNVYASKTRAGDAASNPTTSAMVWTQLTTTAVVASTTAAPNVFDILIEHLDDYKIEWVNGGAAQATWLVQMALSGERVKST